MNSALSYHSQPSIISVQNMQFQVIHHRPNYPDKDKDTVKAEIAQQLFPVFAKYAQ